MTRDVITVHRGDSLVEAAHTMIGAHVSCVVVLENYRPVGIITERDFIKKLSMATEHKADMIVNDIMTKKLFTVDTHTNLFEAQKIMKAHNFRKLVIVENEELKGIVTQTDLCKAVANLQSPVPDTPLVEDVMTKKVLMVSEDDKFLKAKNLMASRDIGSVLVADKEKQIKGVFTEFDIVSEFFLNPNRLRNSYMKDLMTSPVICISPEFDLSQINKFMLEHNFRRLPVLDGRRILGIITQTDIARNLYAFIENKKDHYPDKKRLKLKEPEFVVKKKGEMIFYGKGEAVDKKKRKREKEEEKKKDLREKEGIEPPAEPVKKEPTPREKRKKAKKRIRKSKKIKHKK